MGRREARSAAADHAYPRPQMQREQWISLNGAWDFAIDAADQIDQFEDSKVGSDRFWVPFAPETPLSGVGKTGAVQGGMVSAAV